MRTAESFPLDWEHVLWSSTPLFPGACRFGVQYALTDFRLVVRRRGRTIREVALDDIESVALTQNWWQRAIGTSTVRVTSRHTAAVLDLADIQHGPQLALVLQLRSMELDREFVTSALGPDAPSLLRPRRTLAAVATLAFALTFGVIGFARKDALPPVAYAPDDPLAPGGERRSEQEITAFMEREVMPFARRVLGPIVGGADQVTCETCHGEDAVARRWRMPGVRALPEPQLRLAGLERARTWLDPQVRNAVYGYLAEEDKQSIATYMRQVVLPEMAELMKRPAYDFARSYTYNRSRAAVGCYHCHLVE